MFVFHCISGELYVSLIIHLSFLFPLFLFLLCISLSSLPAYFPSPLAGLVPYWPFNIYQTHFYLNALHSFFFPRSFYPLYSPFELNTCHVSSRRSPLLCFSLTRHNIRPLHSFSSVSLQVFLLIIVRFFIVIFFHVAFPSSQKPLSPFKPLLLNTSFLPFSFWFYTAHT